jgi:hypothetical protein
VASQGTVIAARLVGFDTVRGRLGLFPEKMQRNFLRGGARAAGSLLAKRLRQRIAAGGFDTAAGSVRTSVRLQGRQSVRGVVQYGGRYTQARGRGEGRQKYSRDAWYAHILEWGARAHEIRPRKSRGRNAALKVAAYGAQFGGGGLYGRIRHPGVKPRLFATRTAQQDMPAAERVFEQYVDRRVERFWRSGR